MEDLKIKHFSGPAWYTLLTFWPVYASLDRRHSFSMLLYFI